MIRFRRIKPSNTNFRHFLLNIFQEVPHYPIFWKDFIHSFIPKEQKVWTENYAVIENNNSICEISISPQSRKNARWHLDRLSVGDCPDDIIIKLIKYVMNQYGGDGVETFITFVDDNIPELKELFKQGCNFRECARIELWNKNDYCPINDYALKIFRDYSKEHLEQIVNLHNEMIFPQFRQSLKISKETFKKRFKKALIKKVLFNEHTKRVEGYFLIFEKNNNYYLELLLSEAFGSYYTEILDYCYQNFEDFTILLKKYHTSSKHLEKILSEKSFAKKSSFAILIKDYWAPEKQKKETTQLEFNNWQIAQTSSDI